MGWSFFWGDEDILKLFMVLVTLLYELLTYTLQVGKLYSK